MNTKNTKNTRNVSTRANEMQNTHRSYLNRHIDRARDGRVDYKALTSKINTKFGTRFSVQQIGAYLGNMVRYNH